MDAMRNASSGLFASMMNKPPATFFDSGKRLGRAGHRFSRA
jgi:hypothetical protein